MSENNHIGLSDTPKSEKPKDCTRVVTFLEDDSECVLVRDAKGTIWRCVPYGTWEAGLSGSTLVCPSLNVEGQYHESF